MILLRKKTEGLLDGVKYRMKKYTFPETNNIAPENGWLEYDRFLLGLGLIFRGELLVSGRVPQSISGQAISRANRRQASCFSMVDVREA